MGNANESAEDLDSEWFELIMAARGIGIKLDEVRRFLKQAQASKQKGLSPFVAARRRSTRLIRK